MLPTYKNEKAASSLKVLCFTFNNLSPTSEFVVCCALVFVLFLIYGYFAELIFTLDGVSGWYITLVQFLLYTIFGFFENVGRERSVPIRIYLLLAFLTLGTMVRNYFQKPTGDVSTVNLFPYRVSQTTPWSFSIIQCKLSSKAAS